MSKENQQQPDQWSAAEYNHTASFVYSDEFTQPVLNLLAPQQGERIVDFGCGSGELTKALSNVVGPNGYILGLDSSQDMINKAKQNGVASAKVMDLQEVSWDEGSDGFVPGSFDAVFSNAAIHWCSKSPEAVVQNAWRALKPGGRFAAEMGGFTNLVGLRSGLYRSLAARGHNPKALDPWYFPSDIAYRTLLESVGFRVETIALHPRRTLVPNGLRAWLNLFTRKSMLAGLEDKEIDEILDEVVKACELDMKDEQGNWSIMYVRLRFKAIKP